MREKLGERLLKSCRVCGLEVKSCLLSRSASASLRCRAGMDLSAVVTLGSNIDNHPRFPRRIQ